MNAASMAPDRLDFQLPDFVRTSWVSDDAKAVWEPRLQRIMKAWSEIEWRSIVAGVRACGVTTASPEDFIVRAGEWAKHGLSALPVEIQGLTNYSYSSTPVQTESGRPFVFRLVVGTPQDVARFQQVWETSDQREIGRLLGYPSCCLEFFETVWVDQGLVDTTWPMAVATVDSTDGAHEVVVTGPCEANILWRWMGVRAVPHLPCRFDCQHTIELARRLIDVGREAGFDREMKWLLDILSWPVEWSALHGIAELKTPLLRVSTRTDATGAKYVVQRTAETYPPEGPCGLSFPYRQNGRHHLTTSAGYQRGLVSPITTPEQYPEWYASDNGFSSVFAMDNAQAPVVELANAVVDGCRGSVLDLGCGNGALLKKIVQANANAVPFGVEVDAGRVEHARILLPDFVDNFQLGNIFEDDRVWAADRRYLLGILMPGRLLEVEVEEARRLRARIKKHCDRLLIYAYGDWLTKYADLHELGRRAGLVMLSSGTAITTSLARVP